MHTDDLWSRSCRKLWQFMFLASSIIDCRLTNYDLLRWLVETPLRELQHYRLTDASRQSIMWHFRRRVVIFPCPTYYSALSVKCPLSKVHCLSNTKQNKKDMTNAAVTVNESYQSVRCLTADSCHIWCLAKPTVSNDELGCSFRPDSVPAISNM